MTRTKLPAGLFNDNTAELFAANHKGYCLFNGVKQDTEHMPTRVKMAIVQFYKSRLGAERAYESMVGLNENSKIEQCVKCMFANFDNIPDLDSEGNLLPEYVECSKRGGGCRHEGIGCLQSKGLNKLSPAQKRVVGLCYLSGKEIADTLFISTNTVKRHLSDAYQITGVKSSKELLMLINQSNTIN